MNGKTKSLTVFDNKGQAKTVEIPLTNENLISTIDLTDINNGTFWKRYYNNSDKSLNFLREHTMLIETDLTNYWNQAYNASQLCQYFLPKHWQPVQNNQNNPFQIFKFAESKNYFQVKMDDNKTLKQIECKVFSTIDDTLLPVEEYYEAAIQKFSAEEIIFILDSKNGYSVLTKSTDVSGYERKSYLSEIDFLNQNNFNQLVIQIQFQQYWFWGEELTKFSFPSYQYYQYYDNIYKHTSVKENKVGTSWNPSIESIDVPILVYELDSTYLPIVTKVQSDNPYKFKLKYFSDSNDYYDYLSEYNAELRDQNKTDNHYQIIPLSNRLYLEPFSSLVSKFNLQTDKWVLVPQYASTQDTYFQAIEGGITWSTLLQQLYPSKANFPYFDGYYGLYLNYLKPDNFLNNKLSEYNKYQKQHQEIWTQLYKQFPSILLEQKYQNEDATNSLELLQMAQLAMKDFNNIEREYGITTIDTFALKGYKGQQINIGDAIALNAEELYTGFDDIKESLKQYLFVTDISYTLRQDTDVNLTVNKIKYQDKMIQQLAKLIK